MDLDTHNLLYNPSKEQPCFDQFIDQQYGTKFYSPEQAQLLTPPTSVHGNAATDIDDFFLGHCVPFDPLLPGDQPFAPSDSQVWCDHVADSISPAEGQHWHPANSEIETAPQSHMPLTSDCLGEWPQHPQVYDLSLFHIRHNNGHDPTYGFGPVAPCPPVAAYPMMDLSPSARLNNPQLCKIRIDIENVDLRAASRNFLVTNALYMKTALATFGEHEPRPVNPGRFRYEEECNKTGWELALLNPQLQCKPGDLQRAVNAYYNLSVAEGGGSRRARKRYRKERRDGLAQMPLHFPDNLGLPKSIMHYHRRHDPTSYLKIMSRRIPKYLVIRDLVRAAHPGSPVKIRIDVTAVDLDEIPRDFENQYAIYDPAALDERIDGEKAGRRMEINTIAVKIAWLNSQRLGKRKDLIRQSVVHFYEKLHDPALLKTRKRQAKQAHIETQRKCPRLRNGKQSWQQYVQAHQDEVAENNG